jgi:hypothetical protein
MRLKSISLFFSLLALSGAAFSDYLPANTPAIDPLREVRQCGAPARLADGTIRRRSDVLTAYKKAHPCPVTGKSTGACPGWSVNHIIPLASGGCDAVSNMMWLPNQAKSCAADYCIDRWERVYYGDPHGLVKPLQ